MAFRLSKPAFTIVELLIVIVVIAIIAAISIVAYSGTTQKATISSIQADLTNAKKQLLAFQASSTTNSFPTAINCTNPSVTEICLRPTGSNTFTYNVNNTASPPIFNLTATNGSNKYWINNSSNIMTTPNIVTESLVLYLDAANPASYSGSGTIWYDLSGNSNNCVFGNISSSTPGPGYMSFNGTTNYCTITNNSSLNFSSYQTVSMVMRSTFTSGRKNPWNQAFAGYGTWTHEQGSYMNQYFGNAGCDCVGYVGIGSPSTPASNTWYMIASTRSPSSMIWYKDGVAGTTNTNPYGTLVNTANNITIGSGYAGVWPGDISVVLAYTKALSQSEVTQNLNALRGRYGI